MTNRIPELCWSYNALDEAGTRMLGTSLAGSLPRPAVVALRGTLGAGKTRLVQAIAAGLGIDPAQVTSPTFVLLHEYLGEVRLFHFDAYRLRSEEEFWQLGAEEYLDGAAGGIAMIEWAERVTACLPGERLDIEIEVTGLTQRRFTFAALGERYRATVESLKRRLA